MYDARKLVEISGRNVAGQEGGGMVGKLVTFLSWHALQKLGEISDSALWTPIRHIPPKIVFFASLAHFLRFSIKKVLLLACRIIFYQS